MNPVPLAVALRSLAASCAGWLPEVGYLAPCLCRTCTCVNSHPSGTRSVTSAGSPKLDAYTGERFAKDLKISKPSKEVLSAPGTLLVESVVFSSNGTAATKGSGSAVWSGYSAVGAVATSSASSPVGVGPGMPTSLSSGKNELKDEAALAALSGGKTKEADWPGTTDAATVWAPTTMPTAMNADFNAEDAITLLVDVVDAAADTNETSLVGRGKHTSPAFIYIHLRLRLFTQRKLKEGGGGIKAIERLTSCD